MAQVKWRDAQVWKRKWTLERSRFAAEYCGILTPTVVHRQVRHDETLSLGRLIACTGWIDENGQANQLLV